MITGFFFSEPDIPTYVQGETVIDLVFASEDVNLCDFLESEDIGSDHYLQFWSIDVTGVTRDGRMEPQISSSTHLVAVSTSNMQIGTISLTL